MKPSKKNSDTPWVFLWMSADSPPTTEDNVLVVLRDDFDGELVYRVARHYMGPDPGDEVEGEEMEGEPFWSFTDEQYWPEESIVRWSGLPPIKQDVLKKRSLKRGRK
jgi:hypothetical protein